MQRQNPQHIMEVNEQNEENPKPSKDLPTGSLPEELLLGSITTNTVAKEDKGIQIRSSARVFKKMKLEQEHDKKSEDSTNTDVCLTSPNADQPQIGVVLAEKNTEAEGKGQPIRCSTRVVKKVKQEPTLTTTESKSKKDEPKSDMKKEIRKWSYGDKVMFFEAVNEFGKDFESIQQYINGKLKKKGASEDQMKTKDHVRQCFIRTFHDVSKHVKFSENVKKLVQELYGVINYGELYKKLGVITDKTFMKLSQLIYTGETIIRVKGKNNKIKTPMCRALVKLNQLDQKYEEVRLPNRVTVELRPKDMASYLKVQCLAQNPRLKTTLPIQKRLGSLIECLSKRWKTADAVNYEQAVISTNPLTHDCVPSKQEIEEKMLLVSPLLRLSPPSEAKVELPSINISEYLTRQTICLTAYESRLGIDTFSDIKKQIGKRAIYLKEDPPKKKKPKMDNELLKIEAVGDGKVVEGGSQGHTPKAEREKMEESEVNTYDENEPDALLAEAIHDAVNTILALQTVDRQSSETSEAEDLPLKAEITKRDLQVKSEPKEITEEDLDHIENIRKGWTQSTSESLMIGEIYLMYGSDAKLILEYSWDGEKKEQIARQGKKIAANFLEMWNESYEESWEMKQRNLTSSLSKLLSLAKLHFRPNNSKCPCGHVCNDKAIKSGNLGGPRPNKRSSSMLDSNLMSNSPQDDHTSSAASANVPNGNEQVSSNVFRPPTNILTNSPHIQKSTMQQQLNSIQRLKPKFCNRKGRRPRQKQLVVERKLPLMPNNLSGHQIVRMSIISQEAAAVKSETSVESTPQEMGVQEVITDPEEDNSVISTVPPSPSRILKEGESEWINADVADYSLSSLLGHLETPAKGPLVLGTLNTNMATDLSNEMDAQLQSLMTENSMDFAASFADLAASVANDRKF